MCQLKSTKEGEIIDTKVQQARALRCFRCDHSSENNKRKMRYRQEEEVPREILLRRQACSFEVHPHLHYLDSGIRLLAVMDPAILLMHHNSTL